ncbi:hypothetical protein Tco_0732461 [Tanacetum coccineum]
MSLTESFWVPLISENVLSVIDVALLSLVESYLEFWMLSRLVFKNITGLVVNAMMAYCREGVFVSFQRYLFYI